MTKLNEVTKTTARGVSTSYLGTSSIFNDQLYIGNKIAKVRPGDKLETMSIYKDLFLKTLDKDFYVSLTDANRFNRRLRDVDRDEIYLLTNRVAQEYSLDQNERARIANIERVCDFGFNETKFDYERIIRLLKRMNKYLEHRVTANLIRYYGESLKETKSGIVVFHDDNIETVNDSITKDLETGISLTKKFEK
jgi:hypothetical protein